MSTVRPGGSWVEDREIALTTKEFDLFALLESERGSVVTRERLMGEVWDENWFGSTKTLDVTMGRLRQKLEEAGAQERDHDHPGGRLQARAPGARCVSASSLRWWA